MHRHTHIDMPPPNDSYNLIDLIWFLPLLHCPPALRDLRLSSTEWDLPSFSRGWRADIQNMPFRPRFKAFFV